jgi:hypothetical protein
MHADGDGFQEIISEFQFFSCHRPSETTKFRSFRRFFVAWLAKAYYFGIQEISPVAFADKANVPGIPK